MFGNDPFGFFGPSRDAKRRLGVRDRQILWKRAKGRCEGCGKRIDFTDMQIGHKTAHSRGGGTTLRNSAALCYSCNRLQGTDSWAKFIRKLGPAAGKHHQAATKKRATKRKKKRSRRDSDPFGLGGLGKMFDFG